jgi:ADP-ribosylglycohydrolase
MLGAIGGDVIGSVYERRNTKQMDFPLFGKYSRFTDDTVLTIAIAEAILHETEYTKSLKNFGRKFPDAGYGESFSKWIFETTNKPYNSYGNGSAMRVSPIGFAFSRAEEVLLEAKKSAEVSHNHPEGIKGAQATALAIFLARTGVNKESIREEIGGRFGYDLNRTVDDIRPSYKFDVSCQGSVPEAIIAFLDSENYEDSIRKSISLGGDSDTIACITGGISQAFYKIIPPELVCDIRLRLPQEFLDIIDGFNAKYIDH